jgi:hypothetical protein
VELRILQVVVKQRQIVKNSQDFSLYVVRVGDIALNETGSGCSFHLVVTAPNARPMASIPAQDSAANDNQANSDLLPNLMEPLREQEHTVLVADSSFSKTDHECAQLLSLQKENSIGINTQNNYISYWRGRSPTLIVLEFLIIILSTYAFSFLFTTPYCGFLYRCGCTWVWSGGVNK